MSERAVALGSPRIANVVALGALARLAGLCAEKTLEEAVRLESPPKFARPQPRRRARGLGDGGVGSASWALACDAPRVSAESAAVIAATCADGLIEPGARKREDPQGAGGGLDSNSGFASSTSAFGSMRKSSASKGSCGR